MFNECRHILTSGHKCKAAALRGKAFCYYHTADRRYAASSTSAIEPFIIPTIEDAAGVQVAINQVFRGLAYRRIDRRQAGVYFYGLQIAARLAQKSDEKPSETVREISEDPAESLDGVPGSPSTGLGALGGLAPEVSTCEPPADCVSCRRRAFCEKFEYYEDDVEELEQRLEDEREANEESDQDE